MTDQRDAADLASTELQVRAAQRGDRAAMEALFARYLPRVRRIAACRLRRSSREFAGLETIVQETFVDVIQGLDKLEQPSAGAFCNWLARCVENNIRDQERRGMAHKRGRGEVLRFADLGDSHLTTRLFEGREGTPSEAARAREVEDRLERALLGLKERYREVINLRVNCGMSYREIAEAMGLRSEATANTLFMRARSALSQAAGFDDR